MYIPQSEEIEMSFRKHKITKQAEAPAMGTGENRPDWSRPPCILM